MKKIIRTILPAGLERAIEQSYRYLRGFLVYNYFGRPGSKVKVIAVTGTNGKTTTTSYINSILKAAGYTTALKTTVCEEVKGEYIKNEEDTTSGNTAEMLGFIRRAEELEVDYVVLEVTSQVLDQYRLWGVDYTNSGFTNLSYEHMEYHHTLEAYAQAKAKLFKHTSNVAVLNADDSHYDFFRQASKADQTLSFGLTADADRKISDIDLTLRGSKFKLSGLEDKSTTLQTNIVGQFNVMNAALAAVMCRELGVSIEAIKQGVKQLDWIDGRMNYIDEGQDFAVYCDYAHTPDGLDQVMKTLSPLTSGKIILVQSSMDGRDPAKRPMLGEVAAHWADSIYVTDEEAFDTPPEVMRKDIIRGIKKGGGQDKFQEIPDRQTAINEAINEARAGDTVLIIPFGHFTNRTFFDKTEHWDDREAVRNALNAESTN